MIANKVTQTIGVLFLVLISIFLAWRVFIMDDSLRRLQENGVIRIGYAVEAPYAYIDARGGVTGESPELAKVIVERLGIERIEWVQTDFDLLIAGLLDNRFDVIAAGMFITHERAQLVHFSQPTFHAHPGLLTRSDNPHDLRTYQDLATSADITIAVLAGSVEEKQLATLGLTDQQLIPVPDARTGRSAVTSGLADALALSSVTVRWLAANDSERSTSAIVTSDDNSIVGYGGFAFRLADVQLLNGWNEILTEYVGSPEHIQLISRFGFSADELPGAVTTDMVLERWKQ